MVQYLLSIYQPDGPTPDAAVLDEISRKLDALNDELRAAGSWVFAGGLHPAASATVVRHKDSGSLITDGPYVEGKEHLGGFTIIDAPDLDAALSWATKLAAATTLPIEVRPFHGER